MEFLKVQVLSNKFKPTKYSVRMILKEQILESGEDSKSIKNSTGENQTRSEIAQQHNGRCFSFYINIKQELRVTWSRVFISMK
jgi:hypothetical protein